MIPIDWIKLVANDIRKEFPLTEEKLREIINEHCPLENDVLRLDNLLGEASAEISKLRAELTKDPPLLQCSECHNTESCAGAMARAWNHGRCMHCGGYFKVVRA